MKSDEPILNKIDYLCTKIKKLLKTCHGKTYTQTQKTKTT